MVIYIEIYFLPKRFTINMETFLFSNQNFQCHEKRIKMQKENLKYKKVVREDIEKNGIKEKFSIKLNF